MTNEEIIEGNKIIAEFMQHPEGYDEHGVWQKLAYHSSWDWLMPVVEKIESLGYLVRIELDWCMIPNLDENGHPSHYTILMRNLNSLGNPGKLLNTYKAVVEFCKWHKEQGI